MNTGPTRVRRVLVVDDDPTLLANVAEGLDLLGGYEVIAASNGVDGLQRFFAARPDCVVVDVRMPGLNGYQFVRALRSDPETIETPLVILSALVQDHEQLAGLLVGADAYLIKPVRIADLVQAVERAMKLTPEERSRTIRGWSDL
jgi:two-component system sensor histidine kinase/response regulator